MSSHQSSATSLHEAGEHSLHRATSLLKAMANENRLRILCLLDGNELSVTELNGKLNLSQSALSQHLAILRREGLVTTRRASQIIYYSLSGEETRTVVGALETLYATQH
ncbi:metalloregulator ArsR/SmtB family transcription factor [Halomonas shantousis]